MALALANRKWAVAALAVAGTLPLGAFAQMKSADEIQWQASIYGYFPTISGSTNFPTPAPPPGSSSGSISADASDIIDALKFVFMGTLEAQKGQWGGFTDILYLNVGGNKSNTRDFGLSGGLPVGVTGSGSLDIKATLWTFAGSYRFSRDPASTMDVFIGARLANIENRLDWQFTGAIDTIPVANRQGQQNASLRNWDAIIGIKGRASFGDQNRWFVPWYLDVGTGDSDLTWQGIVGLGYKFSWGDIFAVWRYIDYTMKSGKPIEDLNLNGGAIGVNIRW